MNIILHEVIFFRDTLGNVLMSKIGQYPKQPGIFGTREESEVELDYGGVSRQDRINPGRNGRNSEPTCLLNFNKW